MFFKFRIFRIVYGIALNSAEIRVRQKLRFKVNIENLLNSAIFAVTKFRIILTSAG
jgi:hypothetical protein